MTMHLIWRSGPNEGEVAHATRIESKGRDLSAYRADGVMHTNDPDLIIVGDDTDALIQLATEAIDALETEEAITESQFGVRAHEDFNERSRALRKKLDELCGPISQPKRS